MKPFSEDLTTTPLYLGFGWIKLPKLETILNIMCQPKALVSQPSALYEWIYVYEFGSATTKLHFKATPRKISACERFLKIAKPSSNMYPCISDSFCYNLIYSFLVITKNSQSLTTLFGFCFELNLVYVDNNLNLETRVAGWGQIRWVQSVAKNFNILLLWGRNNWFSSLRCSITVRNRYEDR